MRITARVMLVLLYVFLFFVYVGDPSKDMFIGVAFLVAFTVPAFIVVWKDEKQDK